MEEKIISESLTKDFRHHLAREERSDSTIEKYVKEILRFAQWMKGLPVTKEEVYRWKEHLLKEKFAPATANVRLAALNSFFDFCGWQDCRVKSLKLQKKSGYRKLCAFIYLKCSMINKMPGLGIDKFRNLMAGYAFMMGHPGKKLLFMGQEFAQLREWSEERELDWYLLEEPEHQAIQSWMRDLLHMYKKKQALYELDQSWEGFEWVNADDAYRSIYSFIRHSKDGKHNLLFVINFTPMAREDYRVGVPRKKQYKLILNSDDVKYGGNGEKRQNIYHAVKKECDGRPYSFGYDLPPYGVAVFEF